MSRARERPANLLPDLGPELPNLVCKGRLGSGGFADVYLYEHVTQGPQVAVKLMKPGTLDPAKRRQFTDEAAAMVELGDHPNIVKIHYSGTAPDGRPFLVMEYLAADDLATQVAAAPLSVETTLRYGVQLASVVETAHRARIVHNDIKPANILVTKYGDAKLGDFGVAGRPTDVGDTDAGRGDVGVSMPWSAVEVLTGDTDGTPVSDVYSLGATLWHLLVGHSPFERPGETGPAARNDTFKRILTAPAPRIERHDVPTSLEKLLLRTLDKDPGARPKSALELGHHLQRVQQELGHAETPVVVPGEAPSQPAPAPAPNRAEPGVTAKPPVVVAAAQETTRRPVRVDPAPVPAEIEPHDDRSRTPWLVGAAAVTLTVAIVIAVILGQGEDPVADDTSPQQPSVSSSPDDILLPGSTLLAPESVEGEEVGDDVVFTWPAVDGATSYAWTSGGESGVVPGARLRIEADRSGRTCVDVRAQNADSTSQGATRGCV